MISKTHWVKAYRGPFSKKTALNLVEDLKKIANPELNDIYGVKKRRRNDSENYDIYIKTSKI